MGKKHCFQCTADKEVGTYVSFDKWKQSRVDEVSNLSESEAEETIRKAKRKRHKRID